VGINTGSEAYNPEETRMWIIGLLLLAAAVVLGVDIATRNDTQIDLEAFNHVWTSSPAAVFIVGVVTALVGAFGLWLMLYGLARSRVHRRARRAEFAERDRLADERRREIAAMSTANRGDREPVATGDRVGRRDDYESSDRDGDMRDRDMGDGEREMSPRRASDREIEDRDTANGDVAGRNSEDTDLRDRPAADDEEEAPHRHGIFHRSNH
jgi:hypothetical protein